MLFLVHRLDICRLILFPQYILFPLLFSSPSKLALNLNSRTALESEPTPTRRRSPNLEVPHSGRNVRFCCYEKALRFAFGRRTGASALGVCLLDYPRKALAI